MKIKVKRIRMHPESIAKILETDSIWKITKGIPVGSIVKGMTLDPYSQELNLFIEHESFEPVDISTVCPCLDTELRKMYEK